jgi:formylglycine-generating enzyme
MRKAALAGALLISAVACDSVLDIEEPQIRPGEAGEGGEPPGVAGSTSGGTPSGGTPSGGSSTSMTEGGAAGEGGAPIVTNAGEGGGGHAGEPPMLDCEPGELRCSELAPQICDESGQWTQNTVEAEGDCAVSCLVGECTECREGDKRCPVCPEGDNNCSPNLPQICEGGVWKDDAAPCKHFCNAGECVTPPSCEAQHEVRTTCANGESCCTSLLVPGGTFKRDFDGVDFTDDSYEAKVGAYYLDKFEVTVGRMRQFVFAYDAIKQSLRDGQGKSNHIVEDAGWDTNFALPADKAALLATLNCPETTWSEQDFDNGIPLKDLPVNCVPFNVAYAFCVWDRGRLPTEAEWNFAAAGGAEQRSYPWPASASEPAITSANANYASSNPVAVGSTTLGNARWGQADMAGNVTEWTLDFYGEYPASCDNCLNLTPLAERTQRGGSYASAFGELLLVSLRGYDDPTGTRAVTGFRCARDPN